MIKAIFLDMGDVLVDLDLERCHRAFKERIGFTKIEDYLGTMHQRGYFGKLEKGVMSEEEFYAETRRHCRPGVTDQEIFDCLNTLLVGIEPYKADVLRELASKYDIYMLSNQNVCSNRVCAGFFEELGIPMEKIFKDLFLSYRMKMLKPFQPIFKEAIRRSGHKKEEILFIDDSPRNIAAARKAGLNAEQFTPREDLRAFIDRVLPNY